MSLLAKIAIGAIAAFVLISAIGLFFWARPTPILGVDGRSLGHSVEDGPPWRICRETPDGDWTCVAEADNGMTRYLVDVSWDGCWKAERTSGPVTTFTPEEMSGCVDIWDHVETNDILD